MCELSLVLLFKEWNNKISIVNILQFKCLSFASLYSLSLAVYIPCFSYFLPYWLVFQLS